MDGNGNYHINGYEISEKHLRHAIVFFVRNVKLFRFGQFMFFLYIHFCHWILGPILNLILVFIISGFNTCLLFNIDILGRTKYFVIQTILSLCTSTSLACFIYGYIKSHHEGEADYWDYIPLIILYLQRTLIISIKYGFFCEKTLNLYKNYYLTTNIKYSLMMDPTLGEYLNPETLFNAIDELIEINRIRLPEFKIEIIKNQKKYFISNYDSLFERLNDESKLIEYHTKKVKGEIVDET